MAKPAAVEAAFTLRNDELCSFICSRSRECGFSMPLRRANWSKCSDCRAVAANDLLQAPGVLAQRQGVTQASGEGLCLGEEEFRRELLEQVDTRPGPSHFGKVVREAEAQAEQLVTEGLKRMGWSEADLKAQRKGEPRKVDLAWELRSQTTMPLAWIAERLNMGTRGHLAWLLQQRGQSRPAAPANQRLLRI